LKTESKKTTIEKEFDAVKTFRAMKDKISQEMATMNFGQIKEYLKINSTRLYGK